MSLAGDLRTVFGHERLLILLRRDVRLTDDIRARLRAVLDELASSDESEIRFTLEGLDDELGAALVQLVTGGNDGA